MRSCYSITRDKFLSPHEARHLLKVCQEKAEADLSEGRKTWITRYMLVHLALNSGLRVFELANLEIRDLHIFNCMDTFLIVRHGKGRGAGKKRDVYLDNDIVQHLKKHIEIKKEFFRESVSSQAPLFASHKGNKFTTTGLHISFKKACQFAKLPPHYTIHSSRHTYATLLLAKAKNIRFVQKQLGHASIDMTSLYADVLPEENQKLAEMILS